MPTYDYQCKACGHEWEMFQSMKDAPVKSCPTCSKRQAKRLLGIGAGLIFKGTGFYETDYKKKSGGESKENSGESGSSDSSSSDSSKSSDSGSSEKSSSSESSSKKETKKESVPKQDKAKAKS
ncbi:MAG: hypothetical protein CBC00_00915 [Verrucomicrobia bacterium TMED40]|jgi:putative FmdB family regulatory protein|nr:MAG: hypothetical protein CBC00_00915 [Verrucomicrobia bacterium TMED40]|tara:strand:- start:987 stop:1355 length:369 start_codon:yes stop_codon:yes gene_type:complete